MEFNRKIKIEPGCVIAISGFKGIGREIEAPFPAHMPYLGHGEKGKRISHEHTNTSSQHRRKNCQFDRPADERQCDNSSQQPASASAAADWEVASIFVSNTAAAVCGYDSNRTQQQ